MLYMQFSNHKLAKKVWEIALSKENFMLSMH